MGKQKVLLGEMPENLYRQVIMTNLNLDQLKDIFKFVIDQTKKLTVKISLKETAVNFLP